MLSSAFCESYQADVWLVQSASFGLFLTYRRRKTGRMLTVTLLPEAMKLIRQYMNTDPASPYLFSLIVSKEGTEEAYREYQLALRYFNSQLVILKGVLGLTADLSSYTARHTWATMAYYSEVHPGIISEAMGHSSITVTETYLKPFKNKKIDEANATVFSPFRKTLYGVEPGNNTFYICFGRITVYYGKYRKPGWLCSEQQSERFWRYLESIPADYRPMLESNVSYRKLTPEEKERFIELLRKD